jgi:Holliday junction DNA helicase RuvA
VAAAWEAASAEYAPSAGARAANDAVLALIALGYKQVDAAKAVRVAAQQNKEAGTEELVRLALKSLA